MASRGERIEIMQARTDKLNCWPSVIVRILVGVSLIGVPGCSGDTSGLESTGTGTQVCEPTADLSFPLEDRLETAESGSRLEAVQVRIPLESDWLEQGVVLESGPPGAWDAWLLGPAALVKKSGTYFLYYGGADGPRSSDEGPRHRAIGVATSTDGSSFVKFAGNPVMTHRPRGGEEEGANTAAVGLDKDGNFMMFYGAAIEETPDTINANVKVAVSRDGFEFIDLGVALDHTDPSVYGYGDELFPTAVFNSGRSWYLYYLPNGTPASWDVAMAWGKEAVALSSTTCVLDGSKSRPSTLANSTIALAEDRLAAFVMRGWWPETVIEVRTASSRMPHLLGEPLQTYDGPMWNRETKGLTVFLDREVEQWMLLRSNFEGEVMLHTAPMRTER